MVEKHLLRFCASVLDVHGIEIYANTYVMYLDKLVKINNKLLRILQNQRVIPLYQF